MIVTRFHYPLEQPYVRKLDLICERLNDNNNKKDALILFEGSEGEGKTTCSVASAYYISEKTGREFSHKNVFFDLNEVISFAQSTEKQIIIWDEPALQALSGDWNTKIVKDLTRLLMMFRKKRHCFMINITKFYKFNEYIIVDRALGMVKVYSRNNKETGRFIYIRRKNLEGLWLDYKWKKKRNYMLYRDRRCSGRFPDILNPNYKNNVLSEFDINYYEKRKDEAIMKIGKPETKEESNEVEEMQKKIVFNEHLTEEQKAKLLGITRQTVFAWRKRFEQEIKHTKPIESPV